MLQTGSTVTVTRRTRGGERKSYYLTVDGKAYYGQDAVDCNGDRLSEVLARWGSRGKEILPQYAGYPHVTPIIGYLVLDKWGANA